MSVYIHYMQNIFQIYSFEPYKFTYDLLNDNITNVKTYNIGLSDKVGKSILNVCLSGDGLNTKGSNPLRFNDINPIDIETNIFYNNNIKIDTEGW